MIGTLRGGAAAVVSVIAATAFAGPATAQERPAGWIGISFDVSYDRRGRASEVVIVDVLETSPAAAAGLRRGDRLLAVNDLDRPSELAGLSERLRLRAGDVVRVVVERDGARHELRLRAADRPREFVASRNREGTIDADSVVEAMVREMDSVRVRLTREHAGGQVRVRGRANPPGDAWTVASGARTAPRARTVQAPFEFFVFRGEQHDSLRQEMLELNRAIAELDGLIEARNRELERAARRPSRSNRASRDAELQRLRAQLEAATSRAQRLEVAMAEAARTRAGFEYSLPRVDDDQDPDQEWVRARARAEQYRPLTAYLLGRNRIAGAEVIDLRPELASYFEVEGGVLVVDVAPRTPAALSGIVPGDVITRLDRVAVRSVEDLRFGVSQAGDTVPIALIRRGSSVQVLLRR